MSGIMGLKRCGTCFFAKISPQVVAHDITKRICYGAPPSAIQMPVQGGRMTLQMSRPIVSVSEDACSLHRYKDAEDIARDDESMKQMNMQLEPSETKQ